MSDVKLVKVDRNGTKYYESCKCAKCNGTGYVEYYDYHDGGICYDCMGSGIRRETWKEYTPEYAAKLEERRVARKTREAAGKNAETFKKWHLAEDGSAYIVLGKTFERKDALKGMGAHFHSLLGWYFDRPVEGVETHKLGIGEFAELQDMYGVWIMLPYYVQGGYNLHPAVRKVQDAYAAKDNPSGWLGEVGKRMAFEVTVDRVAGFNTEWGYTHVYTFVDADGNQLVWKTSSQILEKGEKMTLTGTVKEHSEFRSVKQTVLTRCKVTGLVRVDKIEED